MSDISAPELQPLTFFQWEGEDDFHSILSNEPALSAGATLTQDEVDALSAAGHGIVVLHVSRSNKNYHVDDTGDGVPGRV